MIADAVIPPAAVLILGGLALPLLPRGLRALALLALPLFTLALVWLVPDGVALSNLVLRRRQGPSSQANAAGVLA